MCKRIIELDARGVRKQSAPIYSMWSPVHRRLMSLVSSPLPNMVNAWNSASLVRTFRLIGHSDHFDVVWVDRSFFGEIARQAGLQKLIVDIDDLESVSLARSLSHSPWYRSKILHYAELAKLRLYERSLPRRFARLVVCKEDDRRFFQGQGRKVRVIPNGVADFTLCDPANVKCGEILFLGTMDYLPNIDAAQFFARSVFPIMRRARPEAVFHIVGKNPEPAVLALHEPSSCIVHGGVPAVAPYYETASIVVAPIRLGSGTRLKVLEALARGKAVVATSTAIEGLDLRPGIDLEVADDAAGLARACTRLLADEPVRRKMGQTGRQRVFERYHWDSIANLAEQILLQAVAS
jgi:glycosyltransferase involved in cell wall biosynthesis